jgi:hypothetical protein
MKNKKIIPILLQIPLILVMILSFFGSIYAAIYKISGICFATPVIIGIIIALYFYGRYLERKQRNDFF